MRERWLVARGGEPSAACVFVLGLPHSGATRVYQYLVHRLGFAYFTQGVGRHPDTPAAITDLQHRLHGVYQSDFRSREKSARDPAEPRQAGAFWASALGQLAQGLPEEAGSAQRERLRRTLGAVQRSFGGAPFINKNVGHLRHIHALHRIFPESLFVVVEREPCEVALALYRKRRTQLHNPNPWWPLPLEQAADLESKPLEEQVVGQLNTLQHALTQDLVRLPAQHTLCIDYASFCQQPDQLGMELAERISPLGWRNAPVRRFRSQHLTARTAGEERLLGLLTK